MSAIQTWNEMVRLEHEQSDRIRGQRPTDSWATAAQNFKQDPFRTDDAVVEALRSRLVSGETLLDVGAGGGRLALPLALTCSAVAAVEPSPSMCAVFRETADEYDIGNASIIESDWPSTAVEPADVVLCCNVLYVISDIGAFVRNLDSHARRLVLVILMRTPPRSQVQHIWEAVHGEPRLSMPTVPQFLPVLDELGIRPEIAALPDRPPHEFASREAAIAGIAPQLYVEPGTEEMQRLEQFLDRSLQEQDGVWRLEGAQPVRNCIVSWSPVGLR
ncbi:MAG: class I SAM-dependent methyltransferase [Chloroflexota bacterium]|nr:class I SAM-dependent methyltransferase [Chloroflexota bacterium]